jgi:hypothetical protein
MDTEVALPPVEETQASDPNTIETTAREVPEGEQPEGDAQPEKTPAELRIEQLERDNKRIQKAIDRRTRQLYEARAQIPLTRQPIADNNRPNADDSEPLSLTRAELDQYVTAEAKRIAPTLTKQALADEQAKKVVKSLQESVGGQDKFMELTNELSEVFDAAKQLAVLDADDPAALLKYLTDPENADEAEEIGRLGDIAAGKRLARIEATLAATPKTPATQVSKAPAPIESIRGQGRPATGLSDEISADEWRRRRTAEVQARRR